jgi:hypothetical protein
MTPETTVVDLTEQPTTLIYVAKLPGNGLVVGYGWLKVFAFDLPTGLRRLAESIESEKSSGG